MKMSALTTEGEVLMKTKVKVLMMSLCAVLIMLTGSSVTVHAEGLSFGYAYDVQRSSYPQSGGTIDCYYLQKPYLEGYQQYTTTAGDWTLTELGSYDSMDQRIQDSTDRIVRGVAATYTDLQENDVCIHELKDGINHIAYGVIVASDEIDKVVFIGDGYNGEAGYLLSTGEITYNYTYDDKLSVTGAKIATDYAATAKKKVLWLKGNESDVFKVAEDFSYGEFKEAEDGYEAMSAEITVKNVSADATGDLTVSLQGMNADSFELSKTSIASITAGAEDTFTLKTKEGLTQGTYGAAILVKDAAGSIQGRFDVYFTVTAVQTEQPTATPVPEQPTATPAPEQPAATPEPSDDDSSDDNDDDTAQETVAATPAPEVLYTVQKGDTLSKIARINGCSLRELMEANADLLQYKTLIYPNWVLKIPKNGTLPVAAQNAPVSVTTKLYKVQKGDSLWKIARNNKCTVKEIINLNHITAEKADLIYPGWELSLPEK